MIHLYNVENGVPKRTNISVEFFDLGFRVMAPGDLSSVELDTTLDMLYSRVKEQENNQINQVSSKFHCISTQNIGTMNEIDFFSWKMSSVVLHQWR